MTCFGKLLLPLCVIVASGQRIRAQTFGLAAYAGATCSQYSAGDREAIQARSVAPRIGLRYTVSVDDELRFALGVELERSEYELDYIEVTGPTMVRVRTERAGLPLLGLVRVHSTERDELRAIVGVRIDRLNGIEVDHQGTGDWQRIDGVLQLGLSVRVGTQYGYFLSDKWRIFGEATFDVLVAQGHRERGALLPSDRTYTASAHIGVGFGFQ